MDNGRVTREDILKFPFPYKLWIVANLPAADFLCWTFNGEGIVIYFKKLQSYLQSQGSIFIVKTAGQFLQHLKDFQFKSHELEPSTEVVLYFHHPNFKRKRLDLISQIRRENFFNLQDAQYAELENAASVKTLDKTKKFGEEADLCHMRFGFMTKEKLASILAATEATFARETKILQEKLKINEELLRKNSNKRGRSACMGRLRYIDIPESIYVNPYESTIAGSMLTNGNGYTGFYGHYSKDQLESFFGNHLPKFDENSVIALENQGGEDLTEKESLAVKTKDTKQSVNSDKDLLLATNVLSGKSSSDVSEVTPTENMDQSMCEFETNAPFGVKDFANFIQNKRANMDQQPLFSFNLNEGSINACVEVGLPYDDFNMGGPSVVDQILQDTEPNHSEVKGSENQEFYDELRATFELLQNADV